MIENLVAGDLRIEVEESPPPAPIRLRFLGRSGDRYPGKILGPFFGHVIVAALAGKVGVELHFEKLEHFNSSTITTIIQLIQDARGKGVRLVVFYDQTLKWQKLSFEALRVFVKGDDLLTLRSV